MTEITTEKVEALALMAEKSAYIAGVHGLPSLKKDWTAVYTTLRTLLAERDAALVVIAKYRDALQSCGCINCAATIKETPDA